MRGRGGNDLTGTAPAGGPRSPGQAASPAQARPRARGVEELPIAIIPRRAAGGAGGSATARFEAAPLPKRAAAEDVLNALAPAQPDPAAAHGISVPWRPASRSGGGA